MRTRYRRLVRRALRWLGRSSARGDARPGPCVRQRQAYLAARVVVRAFYAGALYVVCQSALNWQAWAAATALDPLWPVAWSRLVGVATAVHLMMTLSLAGGLLAALTPDRRSGRVLLALGLLQIAAFANSFGKISHGYHGWVVASLWLILLPSETGTDPGRRRVARQRYLLALWAALGSVLLSYSISGFWKVAIGLYQVAIGEVSAFAPQALAYHIARRSLQTMSITPVGAFIVEHPWVGWPFFLATLYLELFALVAAFRPRLHRPWGLALMGLHLGSALAMWINFGEHLLLLGILAVASPFAPQRLAWAPTLADLPLVGWPWRRRHPALPSPGPPDRRRAPASSP